MVFKQFHNTVRAKRLPSVWNGLSVMELANVLVYIRLYQVCQEQVGIARYLTEPLRVWKLSSQEGTS